MAPSEARSPCEAAQDILLEEVRASSCGLARRPLTRRTRSVHRRERRPITITNDLVIRDVRIIDGTGATEAPGDVAVKDGRITQVGGTVGPTKHDIDGQGMCLAPGFIDPPAPL
jgi:hypothetical protein